jgi:hypothetical protein
MFKAIILIKILLLTVVFIDESRADVFDTVKDTANSAACLLKVSNEQIYKDCTKKATENWNSELNIDKKTCCSSLALINCLYDRAKSSCSESEYQSVKRVKGASQKEVTKCVMYTENPSMCGTNGLYPVLFMIIVSVLAVIKIS